MKVPASVNSRKRSIMQWLTKRFGSTKLPKPLQTNEQLSINSVLICRPNHRLGNLLLITPLIQEIERYFPEATIDLLVQGGVAPMLFEKYDSIDRVIQLPKKPFSNLGAYLKKANSIRKKKYDLVVNAVEGSSSGKIYTYLANAKYKVFDVLEDSNDIALNNEVHIAKSQIYNLRNYLKLLGRSVPQESIATIHLKLSDDELKNGKVLLDTMVPANKKVLCLYTFATGNKCYSKEWWIPLYERLLKEFGDDYTLLEVLPVENVSQINFMAPTYYSKNIREMAAVMSNTEMYIGADCGIMHLASAAQIAVVGFFSKANIHKYEPYGNNSVGINTNKKGIDDYIQEIRNSLA